MKQIVLIACLISLNGCDMILPKCGFWGGEISFKETPVLDHPIQDQTLTLGETRTLFLDPHMHIKSTFSGNKDCREPDYKTIPQYTARLDDGTLADVSITVDNTKEGRFGGFPQSIRIQTKAVGSTTLILRAKWTVHIDHDGYSYHETQDFEIEIIVIP